jgi:hypothetical protein
MPHNFNTFASVSGGVDLKSCLRQYSLKQVANIHVIFDYYSYSEIVHCYPMPSEMPPISPAPMPFPLQLSLRYKQG